jgi:soluble lytic murein transglycosylase-like protein
MQEHDSTPPFAIAAYNGGSTAVKRWRSRYPGIPIEQWIELIGFPETNRYVKRVLVAQERYRTVLGEPPLGNTPFSPAATGGTSPKRD